MFIIASHYISPKIRPCFKYLFICYIWKNPSSAKFEYRANTLGLLTQVYRNGEKAVKFSIFFSFPSEEKKGLFPEFRGVGDIADKYH